LGLALVASPFIGVTVPETGARMVGGGVVKEERVSSLTRRLLPAGDVKPDRSTWTFVLNSGAGREGGNTWYLLHALLQIVAPRSGSKPAYGQIQVSTDGHVAEIVQLWTDRINGKPVTRWTAEDLVDGISSGVAYGRSIKLWMSNYLQERGVHAGRNRVTVHQSTLNSKREFRVEMLRGSEIDKTSLMPPRMELHWKREEQTDGNMIGIKYVVATRGLPARSVGTGLTGDGIAVLGMPSTYSEWATRRGEIVWLVPLERRRKEIQIEAESANGGSVVIGRAIRAIR
jgi:hypothetical protein